MKFDLDIFPLQSLCGTPVVRQNFLMVVIHNLTPLINAFRIMMKDKVMVTTQQNLNIDLIYKAKNIKIVIVIGDVMTAEALSASGFHLTHIHYGEEVRADFLDLLQGSGYDYKTIHKHMTCVEKATGEYKYREFVVRKRKQTLEEMISIIAYHENFDLLLKTD